MHANLKLTPLTAKRRPGTFHAEVSRVITRLHVPGSEERTRAVIDRVLGLADEETHALLQDVIRQFSDRHRDFRSILENNYRRIEHCVPNGHAISQDVRLLLGAYFTSEYSVEAAALFNPSIVPHPQQEGLPEGNTRFILSFRVTGEGHVSSIEFRSGVINSDNKILLDAVSPYVETPVVHPNPVYDRHLFNLKLNEMGACNEVTAYLFSELSSEFTLEDLERQIQVLESMTNFDTERKAAAIDCARWLARSNYEMAFRPEHSISERVIYPVSENESKGIEDARFVHFSDDDGTGRYYATYTAFNGSVILPQLLETHDFITFKVITLNGRAVQNKGMALFPRKIQGNYVMLSRQDGVNNRIMFSDNIHFWQESQIIQTPSQPWEFVQVGNCGSPIETNVGWLVLTHGVGPMRKYSLGVELLDLEDPTRIIGRLDEPILAPIDGDREGYVPNVVYSCGAMIHHDELIIPYAIADQRSTIATLHMSELLTRMGF